MHPRAFKRVRRRLRVDRDPDRNPPVGQQVEGEWQEGQFYRMFSDKVGYFVEGILIADYRRTGQREEEEETDSGETLFRVRLFYPLSDQIYRQTYALGEDRARATCKRLARTLGHDDQEEGD